MGSILSQSKKLATALPLAALALCGCSPERSAKPGNNSTEAAAIKPRSDCIGSKKPNAIQRTFSAIPQHTPRNVHNHWQAVLEQTGESLNICFQIKHSKNTQEFAEKLQSHEFDYAYIDPLQQVINKDKYIPLLRDNSKPLRGIIVAKKESTLNSLDDLEGKMLLLTSSDAFGSSLLIQAALHERSITPQIKYVHTCRNVFRGVLKYPETTGGGINIMLRAEPEEIQSSLKTIFTTKPYKAFPLSASTRIKPEERKIVQQELISTIQSNDLTNKPYIDPIIASYDTDYKEIESLKLNTLREKFQ